MDTQKWLWDTCHSPLGQTENTSKAFSDKNYKTDAETRCDRPAGVRKLSVIRRTRMSVCLQGALGCRCSGSVSGRLQGAAQPRGTRDVPVREVGRGQDAWDFEGITENKKVLCFRFVNI